jgi:hypothetical protein
MADLILLDVCLVIMFLVKVSHVIWNALNHMSAAITDHGRVDGTGRHAHEHLYLRSLIGLDCKFDSGGCARFAFHCP